MIKSQKLERIVLVCDEIDKLTSGPLTEFLENNPQLVFLYFLIRGCTDSAVRMAQQTLNIYKKKHPAKVYLIKKIDVSIPNVHYREMVKNHSIVASLFALDDFIKF